MITVENEGQFHTSNYIIGVDAFTSDETEGNINIFYKNESLFKTKSKEEFENEIQKVSKYYNVELKPRISKEVINPIEYQKSLDLMERILVTLRERRDKEDPLYSLMKTIFNKNQSSYPNG